MMLRIKYIIPLIILLVPILFTGALAQQDTKKFFVYIQNENGSPFYVREQDNTVLSSSHTGYIIIPQLSKGSYVFIIGLPGDQVAEAAFQIHLNGNSDKGLLLREGNGQLALYSLKDFQEIQPVAVASAPGNRIVNIPSNPSPDSNDQLPAEQQPATTIVSNQPENTPPSPKDTGGADSFSRMLNKIMGTKNTPAVAATTPQQQQNNPPTALHTTTDSVQIAPSQSGNTGIAPSPVTNNDTGVIQNTVNNDRMAGNTDTGQSLNINNTVTNRITNNTPPALSPTSPNNGLQFINFLNDSTKKNPAPQVQPVTNNVEPAAMPSNNSSTEVSPATINNDTASQIVIGNSDCQQMASEDFFQKVRRKMAARSDDEGMFRIAQKYFSGGTCFSTQQIQSLTYLFQSDEYKYKFLELSYPHAYDSSHFPSLIKTLGSDYYRGRFKAMVGR